jgi:hypothetical protein
MTPIIDFAPAAVRPDLRAIDSAALGIIRSVPSSTAQFAGRMQRGGS